MSPSRPFILRPVATTLLMAAILLAGIVAYTQLPVSALPEVDYPTIQVLTSYPGASPNVVETTVTAPLETQFGEMQGLSQMTSTSTATSSLIVLQFNLNLNIDDAEEEVQAAINAALNFLPANLPQPPIYSKVNPADAPVLTLAITSNTLPLSKVEDLVDTRLAPKLSQLSGVGLVTLSGGEKPAVTIAANPAQLESYGINLEDLRTALTETSQNGALGNFDGPQTDYQIDANDQLESAQNYQDVVVAYKDGAPVFLKNVATVVNGVENKDLAAWMNLTPAIILNIQRQPGANTITVVNGIKALLPTLMATLPASIHITTLTDLTTSIKASIGDVEFELVLTVGLVVMVIFLFLRKLSATIIPSVTVPLAIVGTFAAMYLLGFSLDNLSLMALTISAGFVVDDAIVMIENITRFLEMGKTPLDAALEGAGQIGFTIVSLTVSLVAVLIPLLFMGGVIGRLFREFAVTLAVTIVISAAVSLTLTPMMCARILRHEEKQGRFYQASERVFESMRGFYGRTLGVVLRHQTLTLLVAAGTLTLTLYFYIAIPKEFFPVQDVGVIQGISQASPTISFGEMVKKQQELAVVILQDPAVESLSSFIGADGINTTLNSGRIDINLKPINQRKLSASEVIRRLDVSLRKVQGITLYMQPVQDITVDDRVTRTQYQYTLEGPNTDELDSWANRFLGRLTLLPELADVASDQQPGGRTINIGIDRVAASQYGITPQMIENTLYDAFGQRQINTMYTQLNQYHVILQSDSQFQSDPAMLSNIYIQANTTPAATTSLGAAAGSNATTTSGPLYTPSSGVMTPPASVITDGEASRTNSVPTTPGNAVPLAALAHISMGTAPLSINHQGQFPSVTVSFNLAPHAALGTAISAIEKLQGELHFPLTLEGSFQGTAAAFQSSLSNEGLLILAALATVYIILGVLYESFIHPLTILSTLPSAGLGALLSLMLFGQSLSVVGIIGIILLIGIVNKNGILIVDFALEGERQRGLNATDAIYEASLLRFRPIIMTTMAAMLGGVPLAFGSGYGSELRRPLGITVVGGLMLSQVLTLYTTPVIYIFFDKLSRLFSQAKKASLRYPSAGRI
jgi:multidrug efflux pump